MNSIFFLDDQYLNIRTNIERFHPDLVEVGSPYIDPSIDKVNLTWAYPFVFFSKELDEWILLYQGWSMDKKLIETTLTLAAHSRNGMNFTPLDMTIYNKIDHRYVPNQVLPLQVDEGILGETQFFYLPNIKSPYQFIAFSIVKTYHNTFISICFESTNGLSWVRKMNTLWHEGVDAPDYPISIYYSSLDDRYMLIKRPKHTDRRIGVSSSADLSVFTPVELMMQPDSQDGPVTDFYGMSVFPYKNIYLGLLVLYHTPNYLEFNGFKVSGLPTHKFYDGKVDCQWVYSINGKYFQRTLRIPILGKNKNYKCIYPTCLIHHDEYSLLYASVSEQEHGRLTPGSGAIVCYKLRKDGFAALRTLNGYAYLCTKGFLYHGYDLFLNIDCHNGECKIQISTEEGIAFEGFSFDECETISINSVNKKLEFKNHHIEELAGKIIIIEIILRNAELFSITGSLDLMTPYEITKTKI